MKTRTLAARASLAWVGMITSALVPVSASATLTPALPEKLLTDVAAYWYQKVSGPLFLADGRYFLFWPEQEVRYGPSRIRGRLFDADGTPLAEAFDPVTGTVDDLAAHDAVTSTSAADGSFLVAWM